MPLDSCSVQSSSSPSTPFGESEVKSEVRSKANGHSTNGKTNGHVKTNGVHRPNGKLKVNGVHINGVHGNSTPIPYVPIEPKPNSEAPPSSNGMKSSQSGECSTCGRKNVIVTMPPLSRCLDRATCEEVRKLMGLLRSNKPIPVTKRAIICTERHGVIYYLKTVYYKTRELQPSEIVNAPTGTRIIEKTIGEALELVREKSEATKFPPDKANQLAAIWGAVAKEV